MSAKGGALFGTVVFAPRLLHHPGCTGKGNSVPRYLVDRVTGHLFQSHT